MTTQPKARVTTTPIHAVVTYPISTKLDRMTKCYIMKEFGTRIGSTYDIAIVKHDYRSRFMITLFKQSIMLFIIPNEEMWRNPDIHEVRFTHRTERRSTVVDIEDPTVSFAKSKQARAGILAKFLLEPTGALHHQHSCTASNDATSILVEQTKGTEIANRSQKSDLEIPHFQDVVLLSTRSQDRAVFHEMLSCVRSGLTVGVLRTMSLQCHMERFSSVRRERRAGGNLLQLLEKNWSLVRRATIHKHLSCYCNKSWNRYLATTSNVADPSYHLLSMTNQQMSHLDEKLPRLPVPRLEDTIQRYLRAQRALLDDEAYRRTEQICSSFEHGEGRLLQNQLLAYNKENQHTSYTTAHLEDSFLNRRESLLTTNYSINMELTPASQLVCATNLVVSIARFHRTLKADLLTPADSGGLAHRDGTGFVSGSRPKSFLMCMSQLNHLFGTSRIPHESRDELQTILGTRHFVVLHKGYIYTCNLFDDMDYILPASTIMRNLHHILSDSRPPVQFPVASLTAERRDVWARLRKQLQAQGHGSALSLIESALFCLCLDEQDLKEDSTHKFLFGCGGDRWFDKSVQVIVGKDGVSGIQMEHLWSNAMMAMYLINMITKDIQNRPTVTHVNSGMYLEPTTGVQRLEFDLDSSLQTAVVTAKCNLQTISASTSFHHLEFQDYGSNFLKSHKLIGERCSKLTVSQQ
uniref:carnitine O-palmitoyltransferase 2, mitochondrial-like n=1 Tax=Myxine glutinosa TaxID=7769 RepID=UPI00358FB74C